MKTETEYEEEESDGWMDEEDSKKTHNYYDTNCSDCMHSMLCSQQNCEERLTTPDIQRYFLAKIYTVVQALIVDVQTYFQYSYLLPGFVTGLFIESGTTELIN